MSLLSLLFLLCFGVCESRIRMVHVVARHGDRTPVDTYPKDVHINESYFPFGWGHLTNVGKKNQYEIGKLLRRLYGSLLGDYYNPDFIHVQSTDTDRTKMSAQLQLAGLFPPVGEQIWNTDLRWQPIPIDYEPLHEDKLLLVRVQCPRYYELYEEIRNSKQILAETYNKELYRYLNENTGLNIESADDIQSLYNTLKAEEQFGLKLPDWTKSVYPDKLYSITATSFIINVYNKEMQKLKAGSLLKKIITEFRKRIEQPKEKYDRRMMMFLGHDSTVVNLLMAMEMWDLQVPEYNVLVLIELHEIDNVLFVKTRIKNSTNDELMDLKSPKCEIMCRFEKFIDLIKDVLSYNLKEECRSELNISPGLYEFYQKSKV